VGKTSDMINKIFREGVLRPAGCAAIVAALAFASTGAARSQAYPIKPVHLVLGLPAGGGADVITRIVASKLGESLGQQVLVENNAGAGGLIAADLVSKANPDGYTLLIGSVGSNAIFVSLYKQLPYDPIKDFSPISLIATLPNVLVANLSTPAYTVSEFISYAKANPGKISYASAGTGTSLHLSMEMLKAMTGIDVVHVPYKGGVLAMSDLLSGRIQAMFEILPTQIANIKSGKVRALAVTTRMRSAQLPDVPTMIESGVPGFDVSAWYGLYAPVAAPKVVVATLSAAMLKALNMPDLKDRLAQQGATASPSTPEQLAAFQNSEIAKWAKVVKESGATAD
jgi:tripartite-type tricarboxylate transporter receptor subunit TctC